MINYFILTIFVMYYNKYMIVNKKTQIYDEKEALLTINSYKKEKTVKKLRKMKSIKELLKK